MNVTERSLQLLRDVRLRGGLNKIEVKIYKTDVIELAGW